MRTEMNQRLGKSRNMSTDILIHRSIYSLIHPSILVWRCVSGSYSDPKLFHKQTPTRRPTHTRRAFGENEWILTDLRLRRRSMYWRTVGDVQRATDLFDLLALQLMSISVANIDAHRGWSSLIERRRHCWAGATVGCWENQTSEGSFACYKHEARKV